MTKKGEAMELQNPTRFAERQLDECFAGAGLPIGNLDLLRWHD
jgi:hypothetical protein